jgi:surface antigen
MTSALRLVTLALVAAVAGCGADAVNPSASTEEALTQAPCGTALASFDGTTAYSNAAYVGSGTSCAGDGPYGYRYQCVELVMRHFITHFGLHWYGNARDLLNWAPRDTVDVWYNGDGAHPPVPGDMVVWEVGAYGHVALVTAVSASAVDVIEQNVAGDGRATLPYDGAHIGARWGTWVPAGWAHAKSNGGEAGGGGTGGGGSGGGAWSCASSAWGSSQLWTCAGGALHECDANGNPLVQSCERGCLGRAAGQNDLCVSSTSAWNCAASAWGSSQLWTCAGGALYRCDGGAPEVVGCPSGCRVNAPGSNDICN